MQNYVCNVAVFPGRGVPLRRTSRTEPDTTKGTRSGLRWRHGPCQTMSGRHGL